ncbi:DUF2062 domain-containing protein [bacterium]|jgi:uncharacterized protein (DUF2062 family)|nr:DUF2062 domain-containing protein [bacterium]
MIPFVKLPVKIVRLFDSNTSPSEVAAGLCLSMFMGFIPLNGPMAIVLFLCFFLFKINRLAAMLVLPLFKLLYLAGIYKLTDWLGGALLIDAQFLTSFWSWLTHLPVLALLQLNNTLVAGGLVLSLILTIPVYIAGKKGFLLLRDRYFVKIKESKLVKFIKKMPLVSKLTALVEKARTMY